MTSMKMVRYFFSGVQAIITMCTIAVISFAVLCQICLVYGQDINYWDVVRSRQLYPNPYIVYGIENFPEKIVADSWNGRSAYAQVPYYSPVDDSVVVEANPNYDQAQQPQIPPSPSSNNQPAPCKLVFPFDAVWDYQLRYQPVSVISPYYFIDLPGQTYYWPVQVGRSYNFSFGSENYWKQERGDATGNIAGRFGFRNEAGCHDLSYVNGNDTGFRATGGSLQNDFPGTFSGPNRYHGLFTNSSSWNSTSSKNGTEPTGQLDFPFANQNAHLEENLKNLSLYLTKLLDTFHDMTPESKQSPSYYFLFDAGNYKVEESSDENGNIKGRLQYADGTGYHDLCYVTNDRIGFKVTGGNLAKETTNIYRGPGFLSISTDETRSIPSRKAFEDNDEEVVFLIGETTEINNSTEAS